MDLLTNSDIAELLAIAADSAKQPLQRRFAGHRGRLSYGRKKQRKWSMKADHWKNLLELVRLLTESLAGGFKIRRTCLSRLKSALGFLPPRERGKYLRLILHGCAA